MYSCQVQLYLVFADSDSAISECAKSAITMNNRHCCDRGGRSVRLLASVSFMNPDVFAEQRMEGIARPSPMLQASTSHFSLLARCVVPRASPEKQLLAPRIWSMKADAVAGKFGSGPFPVFSFAAPRPSCPSPSKHKPFTRSISFEALTSPRQFKTGH